MIVKKIHEEVNAVKTEAVRMPYTKYLQAHIDIWKRVLDIHTDPQTEDERGLKDLAESFLPWWRKEFDLDQQRKGDLIKPYAPLHDLLVKIGIVTQDTDLDALYIHFWMFDEYFVRKYSKFHALKKPLKINEGRLIWSLSKQQKLQIISLYNNIDSGCDNEPINQADALNILSGKKLEFDPQARYQSLINRNIFSPKGVPQNDAYFRSAIRYRMNHRPKFSILLNKVRYWIRKTRLSRRKK